MSSLKHIAKKTKLQQTAAKLFKMKDADKHRREVKIAVNTWLADVQEDADLISCLLEDL